MNYVKNAFTILDLETMMNALGFPSTSNDVIQLMNRLDTSRKICTSFISRTGDNTIDFDEFYEGFTKIIQNNASQDEQGAKV